jgi:cytochrome P450
MIKTLDVVPEAKLDDPDFYAGNPDAAFKILRREAPVSWYEPSRCWVVVQYDDVRHVSTRSDLFSSEGGLLIGENLTPEKVEQRCPPGAEFLLGSDPPRHGQLRRLISKAFTPRAIAALEPCIREIACASLDAIDPTETTDLVEALAVPVPMFAIADLVGVPREDREAFERWSEAIFAIAEPNVPPARAASLEQQREELWMYFTDMLTARRAQPCGDFISRLLEADIDGEHLAEPSVVMMCVTVLAAGNETTRNLISGGAVALAESPDQRRMLVDDPGLLDTAVDELLRWVTPVTSFARTALRDTQIGAQEIRAGDFVLMMYRSANRDDGAWERPNVLDIRRPHDPTHLAFGFGEHVCLGASLARLEARVAFQELLHRYPDYEIAGKVERRPSVFTNGLTNVPVTFSGASQPSAADRAGIPR